MAAARGTTIPLMSTLKISRSSHMLDFSISCGSETCDVIAMTRDNSIAQLVEMKVA